MRVGEKEVAPPAQLSKDAGTPHRAADMGAVGGEDSKPLDPADGAEQLAPAEAVGESPARGARADQLKESLTRHAAVGKKQLRNFLLGRRVEKILSYSTNQCVSTISSTSCAAAVTGVHGPGASGGGGVASREKRLTSSLGLSLAQPGAWMEAEHGPSGTRPRALFWEVMCIRILVRQTCSSWETR